MTEHEIPEPGSDEWKKFVEYEVRRKLFLDDVNAQYLTEKRGDHTSSWARVDLTNDIYGASVELRPVWLTRQDGQNLLYPGCTHSFHGATGSGKTWAALLAAAQVLTNTDEHVLYLDYESFAIQIVRRLKMLGVAPDTIRDRLHYYRPRHRPDIADIDRTAFAHMLERTYAIAVVDGANICMGLAGLNPNNAEEVAEWHELILNPIAERTGAAVVANDHVPKKQDLSGFAIGSQHKIAGLTGAAFTVEQIEPFGRGLYGKATIRVGDKDREGYVRGLATDDKQPDGLLVAELHIDAINVATSLTVTATFLPPQDATMSKVASKRSRGKNGNINGGDTSRPTKEMEAVSAYWEEKKNDLLARTQTKTVNAIRDRQSNQQQTPMSRDRLRAAINLLIDAKTKGGPYAVKSDGARGSDIYTNTKQYFEAKDPIVISANTQARQAQVMTNGNGGLVIPLNPAGRSKQSGTK